MRMPEGHGSHWFLPRRCSTKVFWVKPVYLPYKSGDLPLSMVFSHLGNGVWYHTPPAVFIIKFCAAAE